MTLNKEITEAISSVQETDLDDEDELETLLADMEQKDLDDKMISAPAAPVNATSQAVRPSTKQPLFFFFKTNMCIVAKNVEEDEEEELRKLQAEMAM
jgi:charged multivesicular body protein 4